MSLTGQNLWDLARGLFSSTDSTSDNVLKRFTIERTKEQMYYVSATTDLNLGVFIPNGDILVTEVSVEPQASVASDGTNFWQHQLVYDDAAAGSATNITNLFTGSTVAQTAKVPNALTMATTGGVAVAAGKRVAIKTTHNGTLAVNWFSVKVKYLITG